MAEPELSLFGIARPAFSVVDDFMAAALSPLTRVVVWGCLMAILVMLLYRLISPQQRLAKLRAETAASRQRIAAFDGEEFGGLMPLVRESLGLSLRQIATITVPGVIASLPLIACLVWLDSAFGYRTPSPAEPVRLSLSPENEPIQADPASALERSRDGWRVSWPRSDASVRLIDREGTMFAELAGIPSNDIIEPRLWWNALVGNPMGYLPPESPVDRLKLDFAPTELIAAGPGWLRGWEAPFFFSLIVLSILLKVLLRIE